MNTREQLFEIIDKADTDVRIKAITDGIDSKSYINFIVDRLLENGVIVLPCKVGDVIYALTYDHKDYAPLKVNHIGNLVRWFEDGCFGKELFLTQQEAEKAVAERWKK